MDFKRPGIVEEFNNAPYLLQHIACEIDTFSQKHFGKEITIVRILGKEDGDSGVHGAYRGLDIRDEYLNERTFTPAQAKLIENFINDKFNRTDGYKTCLHHSFKGGPLHFHCQIPLMTEHLRGTNHK